MDSVIIRADSSSTIGTGHIMRDLVLAKREFPDAKVIFAMRDLPGNISHKIEEAGYETVVLETNDIDELATLVKEKRAAMVVIDHYDITAKDEQRLKRLTGTTLFVFDDNYEHHHCDILLNPNIYADPNRYGGIVPEHCELRCGEKYVLLRDEFFEAKKAPKKKSNNMINVFVAMGGADHSNKNIEILEVLKSFADIHAHVVTTSANKHLEALKNYARTNRSATLHINTTQIAQLMRNADLAIVTPSVTINEVFFMGLPFIAIQTADNQRQMVEYLQKKGLPCLKTFDRKRLSDIIEKTLFSLTVELIDFSDLEEGDKERVLHWRNHPAIRQWMFNTSPISLNEHLKFIDSLKTRDDRLYFLVKQKERPIGVIDFTHIDTCSKTAHFGVYADPSLHGKGKILMRAVVSYAFETLKLDTLTAEVFCENEKAIALYKRFGFKEVGTTTEYGRELKIMELRNEHRNV